MPPVWQRQAGLQRTCPQAVARDCDVVAFVIPALQLLENRSPDLLGSLTHALMAVGRRPVGPLLVKGPPCMTRSSSLSGG